MARGRVYHGSANLGMAAARRNNIDRAAMRAAVTKQAILRLLGTGTTRRDLVHGLLAEVRVPDRSGRRIPVSEHLVTKSIRELLASGRILKAGRFLLLSENSKQVALL